MSIGVDNGHNVTENTLKKMFKKWQIVILVVQSIFNLSLCKCHTFCKVGSNSFPLESTKSCKTHNGQLVLL